MCFLKSRKRLAELQTQVEHMLYERRFDNTPALWTMFVTVEESRRDILDAIHAFPEVVAFQTSQGSEQILIGIEAIPSVRDATVAHISLLPGVTVVQSYSRGDLWDW